MSPFPARSSTSRFVDLHSLLLATLTLVFLTVILGVSTRAAGAGLACDANWPLCDGGLLNLLPATLPSVFEWIHRVVAGITGIFILVSAALAWRQSAPRLVRLGTTIAAGLLPLQVLLGRETVVSFIPPILAAHYWSAMGIYGAFVVATVVAWRESITNRHARIGLGITLVLVPVLALVSPPLVTSYTPAVQAIHYGAILIAFTAIITATLVGWTHRTDREFRVRLLATALLPAMVFFGRQRIVNADLPYDFAHEVTALALVVVLLVAIGLDRNTAKTGRPTTESP